MDDGQRLAKLRHDLANPLSAILAEIQLLLMSQGELAPETVAALRTIEQQAIRMRTQLLSS